MKIKLEDVLKCRPCRDGFANALPALEGLEFDLTDRRVGRAELSWCYSKNLISRQEYHDLRQLPREYGPIKIFACLVVGYEPLTPATVRLDPVAEEMLVRQLGCYLTHRLEGAEQVFDTESAGYEALWWCGGYRKAAFVTVDSSSTSSESRPRWVLEYSNDYLDNVLGIKTAYQLKSGKYSCPGLKMYNKQWWEIFAAYCSRLWTIDEALAELNRTR